MGTAAWCVCLAESPAAAGKDSMGGEKPMVQGTHCSSKGIREKQKWARTHKGWTGSGLS